MKVQHLNESWHIAIVVTPDNVHQLPQTLADVQQRSLHPSVSVLATDEASVRNALAACNVAVSYALPARLDVSAYWATIAACYPVQSERNIFLLAGSRVPEHWDARLVAAGQRAAGAAAIAPLCARHPLLSAFSSATHEPGLQVDELDQWLNDYVDGVEFTVPVMLQSCLLTQGDYWRENARQFTDDRQLLESLRLRGKSLLATDQLYVDDSSTRYSTDTDFLPRAWHNAYFVHHPLAATRHAITELSARGEQPQSVRRCLPVQLHVGHSWGGGLGRWMEDYIAADADHNHLVLRSVGDLSAFGQKIVLYRSTDMAVPIRSWTLCEPVLSVSVASFEYRQILDELIADYGVESLVISSFIGHSLDLLRSTLPTICVLHDFFPFCPALYATYGSPCDSCTESELRACSQDNPMHSFFKCETDAHWLAARSSFIDLLMQERVSVVAPSRSVVERYCQLEPRLQRERLHVVAHGLEDKLAHSLAPVADQPGPQADGRLRIVILGRLTPEKGADLLAPILGEISSVADIFLVGAGESGAQFASQPGVTVLASYQKDELGGLLREINPHLGLLLSTVPETFSYTLSELWAAGIPVLATRLGAFAERITDAHDGWLVGPDSRAVLEKVQSLNAQRDTLLRARSDILQQGVRTAFDMVEDYAVLVSTPDSVPLTRYYLPKRSWLRASANGPAQSASQALHIDYQLPYMRVLADFLTYSAGKMEQTPRLPAWARNGLSKVLRRLGRHRA